ncbi:MAG: hypothetical protein M3Y80_06010, partial [Verrucomicrobiota bacterium]|nr:hypothetical protein [Verrucomicrobiota bacterium]
MKIITHHLLLGAVAAAATITSAFGQNTVNSSAVSRQFHSGVGSFDIPLPGVECREPADGAYHFVVTMSEAVASVGDAKMTSGNAKSVATAKTGSAE